MEAALHVFLHIFPPQAHDTPLVSVGTSPETECPNEVTESSMGRNGRTLSFSVGTPTVVDEMHGP